MSVKVVQARLSFGVTRRPTFEKLGQMYVEIGEGTANVSYILSVAWTEFGEYHTLVTNDGLEQHDSASTQG